MNHTSGWPRLVPLGSVSMDAQRWEHGGTARLTLVVKAVAAMSPGESAALLPAEPVLLADKHSLPGPVIVSPMELLPALKHPEVTLVGSARAKRPVQQQRVRLAVHRRDGTALIDKSIDVYNYDVEGTPIAFKRVPLDYSRAVGGIGDANNPLGRGLGASADEKPCLVDPADPTRVACFAPIPAAFGERRRLRGGVDARSLAGASITIPENFDWAFFNAAPFDQRLQALTGDERLTLEGMHPNHPVWTSVLPGWRVVCRFYEDAPPNCPREFPLRLESLHIDADVGRCYLLWRGAIPWLEPWPDVSIAAQLQSGEQTLEWPARLPTHASERPLRGVPGADDYTTTTVIHDSKDGVFETTSTLEVASRDAKNQTLPFVGGDEATTSPFPPANRGDDIPGAPWGSVAVERAVPSPALNDETLDPDAPFTPDDMAMPSVSAVSSAPEQLDEAVAPPAPPSSPAARRERQAAKARREEEAAAQREAEAEKFAREQAEAQANADERAANALRERQAAARQVTNALYGTFRKPK